MRYLACFLLFSLAVLSVGCGSTGGAATTSKTTTTTPPPTGSSSGQLAASPSSVNFGSVNVGASSTQTVTLSNPGTASVTISQATMSGAGFSVNGLTTPQSLSPGQSSSFSIVFAPSSAGAVTGNVSLANDSASNPFLVALAGTGTVVVGNSHSVDLGWVASTSSVAGYNIYRSTQASGPYQKLNSSLLTTTSFTDSTVASGTTYYYVATAVDANNYESAYSNQAKAIVPTP